MPMLGPLTLWAGLGSSPLLRFWHILFYHPLYRSTGVGDSVDPFSAGGGVPQERRRGAAAGWRGALPRPPAFSGWFLTAGGRRHSTRAPRAARTRLRLTGGTYACQRTLQRVPHVPMKTDLCALQRAYTRNDATL